MSNRLSAAGRLPLIPDSWVEQNIGLSETVLASRARAEQMIELGRAVRSLFRAFGRALGWVGARVDEAAQMSELAGMSDRMLTDIGLKRSDLPFVMNHIHAGDSAEEAIMRYRLKAAGAAEAPRRAA